MTFYPLLMAPTFRHGSQTPWGGDALRDMLLKDAPDQTGESLEVCLEEGSQSMVRGGVLAGQRFDHIVERSGKDLTGLDDASFPLTVKLVDARLAQTDENTQATAWMILSCDEGASIRCGTCGELKVRPGDVYYIPAGTAHTLGAGVLAYEVQAKNVVPVKARDGRIYGTTSLCRGGSRTYYVCDSRFEMCRLNISGNMPLSNGRMHIITPLSPCRIAWGEENMDVMPYDTVVIPAVLEDVSVECAEGDGKAIMVSVSDQPSLREELGYRAENVAGL